MIKGFPQPSAIKTQNDCITSAEVKTKYIEKQNNTTGHMTFIDPIYAKVQ